MSFMKKNLTGALASALLLLAVTLLPVGTVMADEAATAASEASDPMSGYSKFIENGNATSTFETSNLWILIAAFLVFIMHLGFSTLESGLTQSKNTTNILFKNVFIICIGVLTYAFWWFNAMYPGDMNVEGEGDWNGWFAMGSWFGAECWKALILSRLTSRRIMPGIPGGRILSFRRCSRRLGLPLSPERLQSGLSCLHSCCSRRCL